MKNLRRGLCMALAVLMILTCLSALLTTVHAADFAGDVDGSGSINYFDAMLGLQYAVGLMDKLHGDGDVNLDGVVNNIDSTMILQYSVGLSGGFPKEPKPPVYSEDSVTVSVSSATAAPGETVTLAVSISQAKICSYLLTLEYDHSALELQSITEGSVKTNMFNSNHRNGKAAGMGTNNINANGNLITATFKILTEEAGEYPVSVKVDNIINQSIQHLNVTTVPGCVTVKLPHTVHIWTEWETIQEATCTDYGTQSHTCTECGLTETTSIPKLSHDYESVVTEPTCTSDGFTTYTCTVCGYSYIDNLFPVLPHSYESVITNPTCTSDGYTTHTCTVCGYSYTSDHREAMGHFFSDWALISSPTCTTDGETRRSCDLCGETEIITFPATGHSYETVIKEVTCTSDGSTTSTCTECGHVEETIVPALGHSFNPETGLCVNCGAPDAMPGDANGDGAVDNVDAMLVLQLAVGLINGDGLQLDACDVNRDGTADNVDAMLILQFAVGLITEFIPA